MKLPPDDDLRAVFAHQRRCDREDAPAWRDEWLRAPSQRQRALRSWISVALATACIVFAAVFFAHSPRPEPKLSELPPLFDAPPAELFAEVTPPLLAFESPSDFLLPDHINR
jgi:hypothetical protein